MPIETAALDHICNVIRRQFQEEVKELTPFFVVYDRGKAQQAVNAKRHEIYKHPAADTFFPYLRKTASEGFEQSLFAGLSVGVEKSFLPIFKKQNTMAVFFINAADFKNADEAKSGVYFLLWSALELYDDYKAKKTDLFTDKDGIIQPKPRKTHIFRSHLMADAFCAIILELTGQKKGAIPALARDRAQKTTQAIPGYYPEQYPYPVAAEATQIVYDDLYDSVQAKTRPISLAKQMVQEIGLTYDDAAIKQWRTFALNAQEMAWTGFDKNKILGTAIYTSEDPYVRSMAYLVAEILNLEPAPVTDLQNHNPFTDQEVNERQHLKRCEQSFSNIIERISRPEDYQMFIEHARKHNERLLAGQVTGWCAYALLQNAVQFKQAIQDNEMPIQQARENFTKSVQQLPWDSLLKLSRMIMTYRRNKHEITADILLQMCKKDEGLTMIAKAVEKIPPISAPPPPPPVEDPPQEHKPRTIADSEEQLAETSGIQLDE